MKPQDVDVHDHLGGEPARGRELREQGRRTVARLLDAGRHVLTERGYHGTRVDDIVDEARTSHGTFYLYFSNKDDLLRSLRRQSEQAIVAVADELPELVAGDDGREALCDWLTRFDAVYAEHGPVLRATDASSSGPPALTAPLEAVRSRFETAIRAADQEAAAATLALAFVALFERFLHLCDGTGPGVPGERRQAIETASAICHQAVFAA